MLLPPPAPAHHPSAVERLFDGPPRDRWVSWAVTVGITAVAFVLRLISVDYPKNLVFDETYYPKDAWGLLTYGYEAAMVEGVNEKIAAGQTTGLFNQGQSAYVVHPPLGKWLIAWGEWMFGLTPLGWRFAAVVFGSLLVAVTIRLARRLGRSTLVGAIAGLLLTFDGLAFTMSRIGLLDIFQAFFLVAAVACVVADRDWFRHRLADHLVGRGVPDLSGAFGPALWCRPWRVAAGVMFGCAIAVKWNSVFVLAVMGVLSVVWDVGARRLAGAGRRAWWALLRDGVPAFVSMVLLTVPVYLATWVRWLQTQGGHGRQWGATHPDDPLVTTFGAPFASLLKYHQEIYNFHTGDYMRGQTHSYEANPWGWLVMQRPIGIDAVNGIKAGEQGCTAAASDTCLRVISGIGTPVLWWMALIALVAGLWFWLANRDWRFSVPILAALATYVPWFQYADRPLFFFYAICIIPFTVTGLALCLGTVLGAPGSAERRSGGWLVGAAVGAVIANFAFFYPVFTDQLLTRRAWGLRMWFTSWI